MSLACARVFFAFASVVIVSAETPADPLDQTRSTIEKWVETRQLISKTRNEWQADKEILEQNIALFERELKAVDQSIEKTSGVSAQAEKERAEQEETLKASTAALDEGKAFAAEFEKKLGAAVPRLPAPLQDILKPLLNKLPAPGAETKMASTERIQTLVGILNEIDKFNNAISIFAEKRKNGAQQEVSVQTVYVGLGSAYFVNDAGDFAGLGTPGQQGWEWTIKPEIAPAVQNVVRIYRSEQPARFIALPAAIK